MDWSAGECTYIVQTQRVIQTSSAPTRWIDIGWLHRHTLVSTQFTASLTVASSYFSLCELQGGWGNALWHTVLHVCATVSADSKLGMYSHRYTVQQRCALGTATEGTRTWRLPQRVDLPTPVEKLNACRTGEENANHWGFAASSQSVRCLSFAPCMQDRRAVRYIEDSDPLVKSR